jgi:hypothetical protein
VGRKTQAMVRAFRQPGDPPAASGRRATPGRSVGDFHRTLLKGGVYMYPGEVKKPEGKLRLLYENAPLAFVCEKAGGAASDGKQRILDIDAARSCTSARRCSSAARATSRKSCGGWPESVPLTLVTLSLVPEPAAASGLALRAGKPSRKRAFCGRIGPCKPRN